MRLNFGLLTTNPSISRGQLGTTGTTNGNAGSTRPQNTNQAGDKWGQWQHQEKMSPMSPNQTGNWGQRNASNDKPVPSVPTKLLATKADWEAFEERAAIMEFDGGFSRADAETLAAKLLSRYKFDRGP